MKTKKDKKGATPEKEQTDPLKFDEEALERFADGIATDYEYNQERIWPLVGFLEYLSRIASSERKPPEPLVHVEDVIYTVSQHIFGKVCDGGFRQFRHKAFNNLRRALDKPEHRKAE